MNGVRLPPEDNNDDSSDADSDADGALRGDDAAVAPAADQGGASSRQPSAPDRSRLRRPGVSATSDSEGDSDGDSMPPSSDASHPPPPSSPDRDRGRDEAAAELDALLEEEEALRASARAAAPTAHAWKASSGDSVAMDEDDDLWDLLDTGAPTSGTGTAPAPPAPAPAMDDDEEMWDIVNEIEQEKAKEATRPPNPVQEPPAAAADVQVDYLEDLYL